MRGRSAEQLRPDIPANGKSTPVPWPWPELDPALGEVTQLETLAAVARDARPTRQTREDGSVVTVGDLAISQVVGAWGVLSSSIEFQHPTGEQRRANLRLLDQLVARPTPGLAERLQAVLDRMPLTEAMEAVSRFSPGMTDEVHLALVTRVKARLAGGEACDWLHLHRPDILLADPVIGPELERIIPPDDRRLAPLMMGLRGGYLLPPQIAALGECMAPVGIAHGQVLCGRSWGASPPGRGTILDSVIPALADPGQIDRWLPSPALFPPRHSGGFVEPFLPPERSLPLLFHRWGRYLGPDELASLLPPGAATPTTADGWMVLDLLLAAPGLNASAGNFAPTSFPFTWVIGDFEPSILPPPGSATAAGSYQLFARAREGDPGQPRSVDWRVAWQPAPLPTGGAPARPTSAPLDPYQQIDLLAFVFSSWLVQDQRPVPPRLFQRIEALTDPDRRWEAPASGRLLGMADDLRVCDVVLFNLMRTCGRNAVELPYFTQSEPFSITAVDGSRVVTLADFIRFSYRFLCLDRIDRDRIIGLLQPRVHGLANLARQLRGFPVE